MRINKYIAQAGVASRRKADELIANGNVKVNGLILKEPGYDVVTGDVVEVNGRRIEAEEKKVYILLNKPVGYITSVSDDRDRLTVMDLVQDVDARIFPVGRLDYNTSGMLIMTNDGDFAYTLSHPKHEMTKTYRAVVAGVLSNEKCAKLREVVDITIHEGKNRQVRKMFKAVGNNVQSLERIAIGDVRLGRLAEGHYRKLTREEIEYFKNGR